ncbi:MAG: EAL domain-containing protein [Eubacteriales bacterium]
MNSKKNFSHTVRKYTQSIRGRLAIVLFTFSIVQCVILVGVLVVANFFQRTDEQSIDTFHTRASQKVEAVNVDVATIIEHVVNASRVITQMYSNHEDFTREQYDSNALSAQSYQQVRIDTTEVLLQLLDKTDIDGAFYILCDDADYTHTTIKIRNNQPERLTRDRSSYELVIGSTEISTYYNLAISSQWDLILSNRDTNVAYYNNTLNAVKEYPYGSVEQYGYWDIPNSSSREECVVYAVPLFNNVGEPYGIVGIEISTNYFIKNYLDDLAMGYENSFHALATMEKGVLGVDVFTPNGEKAHEFLEDGLEIKEIENMGYTLYEVELETLGEMLFVANELNFYSSTSPFTNNMQYLTFVPSEQPYSHSNEIATLLVQGMWITILVGGGIVVLISSLATSSIKTLANHVSNLSAYDTVLFEETHLTEIDELTNAIQMLSVKVQESSKRFQTIINMTELNLGGYEILHKRKGVIVTQYIHDLLGIPMNAPISYEEWEGYYMQMTQEPLEDMENIYHYVVDGEEMWLRIIHAEQRIGAMGVIHDVTEDINATIAYKRKAEYDELTGLFNRSAFYIRVREQVRENSKFVGAVLFLDLDNLKYTNDTYGHEVGDLLLLTASEIFQDFQKEGGIVARLAGDEFAIFINSIYGKDTIQNTIDTILDKHKATSITLPNGSEQRVRFSTGIAWYPKDAVDVVDLLKRADFAMYQAKQTEKGSVRTFDEKLYGDNIFISKNKEAINYLIENEKIRFMYQPIVDLKTGEIFAYEMLMRSDLEDFHSPLEILKVATAESRLGQLEQMLIPKAIRDAYELRDILQERKVFINSITSQMITDEQYQTILELYGNFLEHIVVEITESDETTEEQMNEKLEKVRAGNMLLALDDFGSGYSNELRLIAIAPDVIKIDMALMQGIATDVDKEVLVSNIVSYAQERGIKIIGEGVEEGIDLYKMMEMGIDLVQGYYVAKPSFDMLDVDEGKKKEIRRFWEEERTDNVDDE